MSTTPRNPAQVRASIESNRQELGVALERLKGEVVKATDWRSQLAQHQTEAIVGAAVAGFVVGGGIAAVVGLFRRRKR